MSTGERIRGNGGSEVLRRDNVVVVSVGTHETGWLIFTLRLDADAEASLRAEGNPRDGVVQASDTHVVIGGVAVGPHDGDRRTRATNLILAFNVDLVAFETGWSETLSIIVHVHIIEVVKGLLAIFIFMSLSFLEECWVEI